ncbi:helix-turn-helix transcriptional regulator [Corynebacterium lowii]|uniref:Transcriptional regulator PadR-like family protein n=1 Tax=Corynebacterium lowii TaxID=1544413 RepID=A0A0Q1AHA1_9CORY|nr:helix-turn-helix transcriptional regulator [Corynebacterium lowii]KQB86045.1 Transcriptional regulator PadR-like family protein [Corynebacterium lowii]MDP9850524.1 DNA-binding PadR family transcriptional regulator [Corynebacterium lowii]
MSIRNALLSLLAEQPRPVGQLRSLFEDSTAATWPVNVGQVYQTAKRLERDGLVEKTGDNPEAYAITQAGREALRQWWEEPETKEADERDALVIKVAMAAINPEVSLLDLLDSQRRAAMSRLRELTKEKAQSPPGARWLLCERQILELEAELRWIDLVEAHPEQGEPR